MVLVVGIVTHVDSSSLNYSRPHSNIWNLDNLPAHEKPMRSYGPYRAITYLFLMMCPLMGMGFKAAISITGTFIVMIAVGKLIFRFLK